MRAMLRISVILAMLTVPGLALATGLTGFTGTADCDGFAATAETRWGSALTATLDFNALLVDQSGAVVADISATEVLTTPGMGLYKTAWFMQAWGQELCGTYTATVSVRMEAVSQSDGRVEITSDAFMATFVCECPTGDACNYTPGYWKNHEENWPVTSLTLGSTTYNQAQLLAIMGCPVRGDATIILAYHLIAAKLNVLNGSDPSINGAISQADALLAQYPLKSKPDGAARGMILDVKDQLADYNELGCGDEDMGDDDKALPDEEQSTWGQLKANYR
ncbi:MAG: hypothetical protein IH621_14015 [Krumholzibacteria bacterium]|nr:hypothetical protein [Candidatus Krumholzibacteria bacterium]